ncbi:MAG: OmpA family protein [Thiohalomonadaceae bacterium]
MIPIIRLLPAVVLLSVRADAGELRYGAAPHEASWELFASRLECRLTQSIPHYGVAAFVQRAGGDLGFELRVRHGAPAVSAGMLASLPPSWMHTGMAREIGAVSLAQGERPLLLEAPMARRLLTDLEQGLFPTVTYRDWADGRDEVVVSVSAVNLRRSLDGFHDCVAGLLPYQFKDIRFSTLNFPVGGTKLDAAARVRLDQVAQYLLADTSVRVLLRGHTDSHGFRRQNKALSQRRAEAVRDYLVQQAVAPSRITVEAMGERKPAASNRSAEGRARNRRVEVSLIR